MRFPCNDVETNEPISSICPRETYVPSDVIQSSRITIPMIITSCQPLSTQWDFRWLTSATNPLYNKVLQQNLKAAHVPFLIYSDNPTVVPLGYTPKVI
jgi:hypothetical protein